MKKPSGIHNIASGKNGAPLKISFLLKKWDIPIIPASYVSLTRGIFHIQPYSPSNLSFGHNKEIFASDPKKGMLLATLTSLSRGVILRDISGLVRAIFDRNHFMMRKIGYHEGLKYSFAFIR